MLYCPRTGLEFFQNLELKALGGRLSLDLADNHIAVISNQAYRGQSIALAVQEMSGSNAEAFTRPDPAVLAGFKMVLFEIDSGLDLSLDRVRAIVELHPEMKVILLGLVESPENVVKLAEAGASGYVAPETTLHDLMMTLRSVQKGEFKCPPHINYALFSHLTRLAGGRSLQPPNSPVLTMRERRVVELLSHNFTNKEIAARLCISQYTAKNHVQRILKKLGLHNRNLASQSPVFRWPIAFTPRIPTDPSG